MARIESAAGPDQGGKVPRDRPDGFDGLRLLLIDDHPLFREGLCYLLRGLGENIEIVEVESFEQAREFGPKERNFDVVLAGLLMPNEDGFRGLRELRKELPETPIVVVSLLEDRADVVRALNCGARGYITKSSSSEVMLSALRLVLAGGVYLPPCLLGMSGVEVVPGRGLSESPPRKPFDDRFGALTARQRDVLRHLSKGESNREIARALGLAEGTVKVHVTAILKALGVRNRTQAVLAAASLRDGPGE